MSFPFQSGASRSLVAGLLHRPSQQGGVTPSPSGNSNGNSSFNPHQVTPYHVQPTTSSGAKRGTRQHWRTTQKNKGKKNLTVDITFVGDYVLPLPLCNDYVVGMGVITIEEGERADSIKAKITQIMQRKQLAVSVL